jgi:hypothetical protein
MVATRLNIRGARSTVLSSATRRAGERTMDKSLLTSNPFALMMHPDDVFQAMERSDRLGRLQSRVCKPLDKPLIPRSPDEVVDEIDDNDEEAAAD